MEYESTQKEEYSDDPYTILKRVFREINKYSNIKTGNNNKFYVDIRVEIPDMDAEIFEDAVDIGNEFVDLLVEQEENKYYNIYLKTVGVH